MGGVGVEPGVPEERDGDLRRGHGEGEAEHSVAKVAAMALGNGGDEIRGAGQREGGREAADDGRDVPSKADRLEGVVDRAAVETRRRYEDVPPGGISRGRDLPQAERMTAAHN